MWRRAAFERALSYLRNRILAFTALPVESIVTDSLTAKLREIGHLEGASSPRSDVA